MPASCWERTVSTAAMLAKRLSRDIEAKLQVRQRLRRMQNEIAHHRPCPAIGGRDRAAVNTESVAIAAGSGQLTAGPDPGALSAVQRRHRRRIGSPPGYNAARPTYWLNRLPGTPTARSPSGSASCPVQTHLGNTCASSAHKTA